jgi:hypothetical protein
VVVLLVPMACGPSVHVDPAATGTTASEPLTGASSAANATVGADGAVTTTPADGGSTTTAVDPTAADATAADTTAAPVCMPVCSHVYACNDGEDNDGDGLIDLDDLDCLGPCQDDEASTFHGLPLGNANCDVDCYFDDNVGQGDDGCRIDTRCDPLSPNAWMGCSFGVGTSQCHNQPPEQTEECQARCLPMVPPGCDCFGCCTFTTPRGPEDRWVADPACTVADPTSCSPCTQYTGCVNLCDDPCEWCFDQPALPPGCSQATCEHGSPCTDHCDCDAGSACVQGCCRPLSIGW